MTIRLALRNMKRSIASDIVYFITLTTGIALIYTFYAMTGQFLADGQEGEWDRWFYTLSDYGIPAIRVVMSSVMTFLIVYANNFFVKRRKKEIGIYLVLGMGRGRLAGILLAETAFAGILSLLAGILLGIVLAQGMSMFAAGLFETDMSAFVFTVSGMAVWKTVLHFLVIYAVVFILDLVVVGKARLSWLLNGGRPAKWNAVRNPWVCLVVFLAAAGILGHVYFTVTVRLDTLISPDRVFTQIGLLAAATFMVFWSLSGLLLFLAGVRKRFYLGGIHAFTAREIGSRVSTNTVAGGLVCFLMFLAISIFLVCFSVSFRVNENLKTLVPVDMEFSYWCGSGEDTGDSAGSRPVSVGEMLRNAGVSGLFQNSADITVYTYNASRGEAESGEKDILASTREVIGISDYNKLAKVYGMQEHTLSGDEYFVVANAPYLLDWFNRYYLSENYIIILDGKEYHPKYRECQEGFLRMSYLPDNTGYTVMPDEALSSGKLVLDRKCYFADYNAGSKEEAEKVEAYVKSGAFQEKLFPGKPPGQMPGFIVYKSDIYQMAAGITSMVVFMGFYVSIMFFIAGASLFSLKELSQAFDNREKYETLAKIGVDQNMIRRSLLCQNALFFGVPLLFAMLHAVFGIRALAALAMSLTELFVEEGIWDAMWLAGAVLLGVYIVYFIITYRCGRNIIEERND